MQQGKHGVNSPSEWIVENVLRAVVGETDKSVGKQSGHNKDGEKARIGVDPSLASMSSIKRLETQVTQHNGELFALGRLGHRC